MQWIKRNLWLSIGGALAVLLLVGGTYYWWSRMQLNKDLDGKLEEQQTNLKRLYSLEIFPNTKNIDLARKELGRVQAFVNNAQKYFPPTQVSNVNNQSYKILLENTIADLRRAALTNGVELPTNYNFSFEAQIQPLNFEPDSLRPLSQQLKEIQIIANALFSARIDSLQQVRRVRVSQYDAQNSAEYLTQGFTTNEVTQMAVWPYEFVFNAFSQQLAEGIGNVIRVPMGVIVKSISLEPAVAPQTLR